IAPDAAVFGPAEQQTREVDKELETAETLEDEHVETPVVEGRLGHELEPAAGEPAVRDCDGWSATMDLPPVELQADPCPSISDALAKQIERGPDATFVGLSTAREQLGGSADRSDLEERLAADLGDVDAARLASSKQIGGERKLQRDVEAPRYVHRRAHGQDPQRHVAIEKAQRHRTYGPVAARRDDRAVAIPNGRVDALYGLVLGRADKDLGLDAALEQQLAQLVASLVAVLCATTSRGRIPDHERPGHVRR